MTARNYDYILTVSNAVGFQSGNVVFGATSTATAYIANVDVQNNYLKVKMDNARQYFSNSETLISNSVSLLQVSNVVYYTGNALANTYSLGISANANSEVSASFDNVLVNKSDFTVDLDADTITFSDNVDSGVNVAVWVQTGNTNAIPFSASVYAGNVTTASSTITNITPSPFIAEKNSFTQNPVVRLISVYYPGEWYPPNANGNPTLAGAGRAWPNDFPFNIAEIQGDFVSDIAYNVTHDGDSYTPYPLNVSAINQSSEGQINEITLTLFNIDNVISTLIEDPFIAGNNSSNSVVALVNHEYVHGIDPRTVNFDPADVGSEGDEAFDTLTRARANGLAYDSSIEGAYGRANASFTRDETLAVNGTWQEQKLDTRDLLGAVVEIKTTFANFLDVWPEHSSARYVSGNVVEVYNAMPYRIGDNVKSSTGNTEATIQAIEENRFLFLSNALDASTAVGSQIYIINTDADPESFVEDKFKIDQLESLNETIASFGLVSWLQYFKIVLPKRKYYKNTCQWVYKGEECQYPGHGSLPIPGTVNKKSNANPIAANNEVAASATGDIRGKSLQACTVRGNEIHFGGFPATGRTIPRQ